MSVGNTRTLLDRVGVKVEHSPQDRNTREARLDILNRFLLDVSSEQPWRFLQTEADFKVWYQRNYETTGYTVGVTNGSAVVVVGGFLGEDYATNNAGMDFNDGLDAEGGASAYTISAWQGSLGGSFYLDRPYEGTTNAALTTWSIGNDKVLLPLDCGAPLGFIDRTTGRGRLISWDRRREEMFLSWLGDSTGDVWWIVDGDTPYDRPPDSTFRGSLSTSAGTLDASSIFQYAYTFTQFGRETMPSIVVEVTTGSGANNQVVLDGIEDTTDGGVSVGKTKRLYRRQVSRSSTTLANVNGPWMFRATIPEASTTYTDSAMTPVTRDDSSTLYYEGPSQFMRPKQRPATDETLRIRYLQRCKKLVSDADIPTRWPGEYYDLLVLYAAMEIVGSNSELSKSRDWERQATSMKKRMQSGWVQVPDLPTQRRGWGVAIAAGYTANCGTVTSDYGS